MDRNFRQLSRLLFIFASLCTSADVVTAQFNLPIPRAIEVDAVIREDMQVLFTDYVFEKRATQERKGLLKLNWREKLLKLIWKKQTVRIGTELKKFAESTVSSTDSLDAYNEMVTTFCKEDPGAPLAACKEALTPTRVLAALEPDTKQKSLSQTWVSFPFDTKRTYFSRYLRNSNVSEGVSVLSHFAANVSQKEAYVLTSLVRGAMGRGIFSADQALVVTNSDSTDPATRDTIENDRANALRAINNGGTLVGRYTIPVFARSGPTASSVVGFTFSAGVIGPVTGESKRRTGVASSALEVAAAFPIRDLSGNSALLADLTVGVRAGYTYAGLPLREAGGRKDVAFLQGIVGLRQNGALSVSALVTIANNGMNNLVPQLSLNFAAVK